VLKEFGYPWTYFVYPQFITRTEGKGAASWPDLLELDREGVDVESHSMTHPKLTSHKQTFAENAGAGEGVAPIEQYGRVPHTLSAQEYDDFLTNETSGAKAILEKELGKKIKYFAYPYGAYNKQVEAKAVAAGYEAIFTVAGNPVHITTDIHSVGRYIITKPDEPRFAGYLHQGVLGLTDAEPAPGAIITNPRPVITAVLGFNGSPASLETEVDGLGVAHDFDPQTSTVRLYLARDLIQPENMVSIRAKDAQSGQTMAANWHFNYEPAEGSVAPVSGPSAPAGMKGDSNAVNSAPTPASNAPMAKPTPILSPAITTTTVTNTPAKSAPTTP
jgi:peptidoglycan/xylan/chitin deacetylase (PgdA/CDA1 family)